VKEKFSTTEDNFDAELVTIVDKKFEYEEPFVTLVADRQTGAVAKVDLDLWEVLDLQRRLENAEEMRKEEVPKSAVEIRRKLSVELNERLDYLALKIERNLLEVIMDGRLKIAFLIDSDGGSMHVCNLYRSVLEREGQRLMSEAYVSCHGVSAGFELMTAVDKACMLRKSHLLWHFSDSDDFRREDKVKKLKESKVMPRQVVEELGGLINYFSRSKNVDQEYLDSLMRLVTMKDNPQGDLWFSGAEMAELELAQVHQDIESLQTKFNTAYKLSGDFRIKEFWDISAQNIEEMGGEYWGDFFVEMMRNRKRAG
jgi:hypothetical protein